MNPYKVSIIIPTYKPGNYIYDCLSSIINQKLDYSLFELIIILNGEKEPFYSNIKLYLEKYKDLNYKIIFTAIKGVSNARNIGIEESIGEFICFIDDDDYISENYLSIMVKTATRNCIPICNILSFDNVNKKFFLDNYATGKFNSIINKSFIKYRGILSIPVAKLIHKDIIGNKRFNIKIDNGEDALFITSLTNSFSTLYICPQDAIYYVRIREGSASRKKISLKKLTYTSSILLCKYFKLLINISYPTKLILMRFPGVIKNFWSLVNN